MGSRRWAARISWRQVKLWQLYLLAGATFSALYALVPPFKGSAPLINVLGLSGVLAVLVGVRRNRPQARLAWLLCALGLFLFWLGDVYTYTCRRSSASTCRSPHQATPSISPSTRC